jgi:HK97 family phage portal protein
MALFGRRKTEDRTLSRDTTRRAAFLPFDPTGTQIAPAAAMQIADVFACVRVLAESAASLPLIAYRRTAEGRERAGGRVQDLIDRPAPGTTTAGFIGQMMVHLATYGNAFIAKYRNGVGSVAALGLLEPDSVNVELEDGEPKYTVYSLEGIKRHGTEDILHIRAIVSQDGILGLSPIRQAAGALTLNSELQRHARDTMTRGARLSGVLTTPEGTVTDPDSITLIKEQIQESWVGPENSGGIAFVTGGLTFSPLSMPLQDAQFIEQRQLSTAEICRIFRIPNWLVGAASSDSMTYSNTESQALSFQIFTLKPWLVAIEQALTGDQDLMPSTTYVEFLVDGLLRADSKTRATIYQMALDPEKGWMRRDEIRRLENLPEEAQ